MDQLSHVTTYVFDPLNRVIRTIYADDTTNKTIYDDLGRVAQTIDARGTVTGNAYDIAGRRVAVTNALGTSVQMISQYTYDPDGNQLVFMDAKGNSTTNVYDRLNRQVQVQYPDGTSTLTGFDAASRKVAQTNQDGIVTLFGYDGAGRLVSVTNALNEPEQIVTRYQYDEAGNEVAQVDALGRTNAFAYDGMGRRISHTRPDGFAESFGYDTDGNLVYQTNFDQNIIFNQYDELNRLTNRSCISGHNYGDQDSYTYMATGQRASAYDVNSLFAYTNFYDDRNRLMRKTSTWGSTNGSFDGGGHLIVTLSYGYDENGNLTNLSSSMANGVALAYSYDPLNQITNVLSHGELAASYTYDAVGNLQALKYGNGVTNQYQYDSLNRLTNLVWMTNGVPLAGFYYQLGKTGNRTNLSEFMNGTVKTIQTNSWQYDNLYRLTQEIISSSGVSNYLQFQFDPVGNRTNRNSSIAALPTTSYQYTTNDWLTTDGYGYNLAGYDTSPGDGNTTYSATTSATNSYWYDSLDRLTQATNLNLAYDADGDRVEKGISTNGGYSITYYLVDDRNPTGYPQVLEEYQAFSSSPLVFLNRAYNYGLSLMSQQQYDTNTLLPTMLFYYSQDGHGSVRFLTDTNQNITDWYTYNAYGTLLTINGSVPNNYLYAGEQFDPDLGLYYLRARYYKTDTGRFWTMDTFQGRQTDPLSLHRYLYASDDPVNRTDPSGNDDGLDSMPNISSAIFSHLVADIDVADISSGESTPTDDVVWNPGLGGKHARFIVVRGIPTNSWSFIAPNLETFFAPHGTDFTVVYNAGIANGEWNVSGINNAVGTYGKFDFQRNMGRGQQPDGPYNYFYPAYVHASNYGVGVFMNGCGFSLDDTIRIANSFAHGESRNAGDPQQKEWWTQGWEAAHIGAYNGLGLPHLY